MHRGCRGAYTHSSFQVRDQQGWRAPARPDRRTVVSRGCCILRLQGPVCSGRRRGRPSPVPPGGQAPRQPSRQAPPPCVRCPVINKASQTRPRSVRGGVAAAVLLLACCCSPATACTLLVYGDSLSTAYGMDEQQGWVALLADRLVERDAPCRVVNASVSGQTATGGLSRLPVVLDTWQPTLVILALGGNDGLRGLPLAHVRAALLAMIRLARQAGAEVLLAGIRIPPNYGPRYTEPFFRQYQELAASQNLPLVPFLLDGVALQPGLMQRDGIHPRAAAQPVILENVWAVLQPLLHKH